MGKDRSKDGDATTSSTDNKDHSRDQESRDAMLARTITVAVAGALAQQKSEETQSIAEAVAGALAKQKAEETQSITEAFTRQMENTQSITEAFTRQMEKAHAQYEKLFKESCTAALPTTLKVTSSSDGFRAMDPFDWTMDKDVYQRWQLWSHKARLTLDAMEGDTEKTKISYLHHWLNGAGIAKIEGWKNSKILISQADYDALEERDRVGKYSLDKIESYFSLCELVLTPRSNPLLAVEDLYLAKQGSMTSGEFHSHILKIVKRCQFPNQEAEERAVRDAIFMGMNSPRARDKAINLMNEEGKQVTVEFLLNHLTVEDGNTQHKFLSQLDSNSSVNMIAYYRRQNRGKSNRAKQPNGRNGAQNKTRVQTSSSTAQPSRKPPGMEGKCMRWGKPEHQQGEKCAAKNAKRKECHNIGHFYKVCQSKKKTTRTNLAQIAPQAEQDIYYNPQAEQDTHIDECGIRQPNPPMVNMLRIVNHIGTTSGSQGNHLKFPIDVDPRGPYKNHLIVKVDTGADVNCMNEKTFRRLFPKVKLSVCPHEIQNFGNSTADISILGQFRTYLQFRGEKYLTTFSHQCRRLPQPTQPWSNLQDGCTTSKLPGGKCGKRRNRYNIKCVQDFTGFTSEAVPGNRFKSTQSVLYQYNIYSLYNNTANASKQHTAPTQPVRIQVLLVCLSRLLFPGPQCLPTPHPVQDNQPLKYIKIPHTVNLQFVVCMYTNHKVRLANQENRQP